MFSNEMVINVGLFILGFVFLTIGAEFLVRGSSRIASRLRIPTIVIGLTIVAFGTSLPEFLVSLVGNLQGDGGSKIAIGNIIGSNIANLGLILGVAGAMTVLCIPRQFLQREYLWMLAASALFALMMWDGEIGRLDGLLLALGLLAFTYFTYRTAQTSGEDEPDESKEDKAPNGQSISWDLLYIGLGIGGLMLGANWLIASAQVIAKGLGVSDLVIGLTLVAIGTSLPELAATVVSIIRKESELAIGNVVGSNLFNILFIGGFNSMIKPLPVPAHILSLHVPAMLGITLLVYLMMTPKPNLLNRWKGIVLVTAYVGYTGWLLLQQNQPMALAAGM